MYDTIAPRRDVWIRQTQALSALRALVEGLGTEKVLPVKGIVTARTLYRDPTDRPIADLDVRVRPEDIDAVLGFARAGGHPVRIHTRAYRTVVLEVEGIDVDAESAVGPPGLSGLTVEAMLGRSELRPDLFGFPCRIPETYDHALLLMVNAFKDKLVLTPAWSVDDLVHLAALPSFDPEKMAERAREAGSVTLAWIVADWLGQTNDVWRRVRDALAPSPPRPAYVRRFRRLVEDHPRSVAARIATRLAPDDVGRRASALAHGLAFEIESRAKRVARRLRTS